MNTLHTLVGASGYLLTGLPQKPVAPPCDTSGTIPDCKASMPPGFDGFLWVMSWAKWIGLGLVVVALIAAGVAFAFSSRREGPLEHAKGIIATIVAAIIVGGAAAFVGFLVA